MNFWWVNQNQTFRHEFGGGYLWSPKFKAGGQRNPFYDFMRQVRPGDLVFSFADTLIQGIGIAQSHCYTSPRPNEFGRIGEVWDAIGWRVDVRFQSFAHKIRPKEHIGVIRNVLPERYSPLQASGDGMQGIYLTSIPLALVEVLAGLIGREATPFVGASTVEAPSQLFEVELKGIQEWEEVETRHILAASIPDTERQALVTARIGQGRFKQNVSSYERECRVTRVRNSAHLVASHIKPWRESTNEERLAAGNGLMLTPTIDHLFDRGFISFDDSGDTLISPVADRVALKQMGINPNEPPQVGSFSGDQRYFLAHHRRSIFLS